MWLELEKKLLKLKRDKRRRKTDITKTRHHVEKLCVETKDVASIEEDIEKLWVHGYIGTGYIGDFGRVVCFLFEKEDNQSKRRRRRSSIA